MTHFSSLCNGLGIGALGMYFLDPLRGRYRRALVRDRGARWMHDAQHALSVGWRDLEHRACGWLAKRRSHLGSTPASDATLQSRVRSKLGRAVSHPRAIEVTAHQGRIRLSGHLLAGELSCVLDCVRNIPGVTEIDNALQVHDDARDQPQLQGSTGRHSAGLRIGPATQFLLGSAACAAATYFLARRVPLPMMLGAAAGIAMAGEARAVQHQQSQHQRTSGAGQSPPSQSQQSPPVPLGPAQGEQRLTADSLEADSQWKMARP
jgi:hypothetical protein